MKMGIHDYKRKDIGLLFFYAISKRTNNDVFEFIIFQQGLPVKDCSRGEISVIYYGKHIERGWYICKCLEKENVTRKSQVFRWLAERTPVNGQAFRWLAERTPANGQVFRWLAERTPANGQILYSGSLALALASTSASALSFVKSCPFVTKKATDAQ
jgi:hypothetical protein